MGNCNHFLKKDSALGKYYCYCEKYVNEIEISVSNISKEHIPHMDLTGCEILQQCSVLRS